MTETDKIQEGSGQSIDKLPVAAALVALVGLVDAVYLTIKHYTDEPVPCTVFGGCEQVLTSSYAEFAGIPIAAIGAAAYFAAFSFALLAAFGNRVTWTLFSMQVIGMSLVTAWLVYLQGYVINAWCQFCLISAATTFSLLVIFLISKISAKR
jgi:uncharacterized membrane protein